MVKHTPVIFSFCIDGQSANTRKAFVRQQVDWFSAVQGWQLSVGASGLRGLSTRLSRLLVCRWRGFRASTFSTLKKRPIMESKVLRRSKRAKSSFDCKWGEKFFRTADQLKFPRSAQAYEWNKRASEWIDDRLHVSERPMFAQFISYLIMLIDWTFDDVSMKVRSISRCAWMEASSLRC